MKQIAQRLVADMRWRMSAAGKRFRPSRKEMDSWGASAIPFTAPLFGGCAMQAVLLGAVISAFDANAIPAGFLMLLLTLAAPFAAFGLSSRFQRAGDLKRYARLVQTNERFALIEYSKLLERQIQVARSSPALGGPDELAKLTELHSRITALIREGAGRQRNSGPSALASEATLAESVLEAYSVGNNDGLAELDARLPDELRSRLDELDAEAGKAPEMERSEH